MILGYNTNGFAHHRLEDAITIIAEEGYHGVALTPDVHDFGFLVSTTGRRLYPLDQQAWDRIAASLKYLPGSCVIETGARYLLDARIKHQPNLVFGSSHFRQWRLSFLKDCVELAVETGSTCVSFWSGATVDPVPGDIVWPRLVKACRELADYAAERNVRLAFEPEPGMFIDTMDKFAELHAQVNHPNFGLTLDVGHLVCTGELPIRKHIEAWKHCLWNVHIEDMKAGVHDHLMFGDGEVDFADVFAGLTAVDYQGMVSVELSRHSYDAVNTARKAKAFLDRYTTPV